MGQAEVETSQDLNFEASTYPVLHTSSRFSKLFLPQQINLTTSWKIINYILRGGAKTTAILKVSPPNTLKL